MKLLYLSLMFTICCVGQLHAELSKDYVRTIAEKYVLMIAGDADKFSKEELRDMKALWAYGGSNSVGHVSYGKASIKSIKGNCVIIKYQQSKTGYLLFTEDGKIKYDCTYNRHPIESAFLDYHFLEDLAENGPDRDDLSAFEMLYKQLKDTGIPLFDYSMEQPTHEQLKSLKQIKDWLLENGSNWDNSEPKVMLPKEVVKKLREQYT